jgi:hypothetical protein
VTASMPCSGEREGADSRGALGRGRAGARARGRDTGEWGRAVSERE